MRVLPNEGECQIAKIQEQNGASKTELGWQVWMWTQKNWGSQQVSLEHKKSSHHLQVCTVPFYMQHISIAVRNKGGVNKE